MIKQEELDNVISALGRAKKVLITSHMEPDGDAIGSMLALGSLMRRVGKSVQLLLNDAIPERYRFLPKWEEVGCYRESKTITIDPDTIIVLDAGELSRVGEPLVSHLPNNVNTINIDHHISNHYFARHNLVDAEASATGELIWLLFHSLGVKPTETEATHIYASIFTDTGSFRYSNTTSKALHVAAEMVGCGASPQFISRGIGENKSLSNLKLMGLALSTLTTVLDGQFVYLYLTRKMFETAGIIGMGDTEGLVNFARSIKGCRVSVLFRETEDDKVKVSLRGSVGIDVNSIAVGFGGGGHEMASGYISQENLEATIATLTKHVAALL